MFKIKFMIQELISDNWINMPGTFKIKPADLNYFIRLLEDYSRSYPRRKYRIFDFELGKAVYE